MHPLLILGSLAVGGYAIAKKVAAPEAPKQDVRGQIVSEASKHAQRRMANGATPEQAAAWAAKRAAKSYQQEMDASGDVPPDFFSEKKVSERYRF